MTISLALARAVYQLSTEESDGIELTRDSYKDVQQIRKQVPDAENHEDLIRSFLRQAESRDKARALVIQEYQAYKAKTIESIRQDESRYRARQEQIHEPECAEPPTSPKRHPNKKLQALAQPLLSNIFSNKSASFFAQPVSYNEASDYYDLIFSPTDLRSIRSMVRDGRICSAIELERELQKMFANAVMYNAWDSDISRLVREMQMEVDSQLSLFLG